ncbi:hypothetical protein [Bartonella sp. LJL80]
MAGHATGPQPEASFWKARLLQAILVGISGMVVLPSLWAFFFLTFGGWFQTLGFSLATAFFKPYQIYPPSFLTACVIVVLTALRSASWGSVSLRFCLIASLVAAIGFDAGLRILISIWPQKMADLGLANEAFFYWVGAWFFAGGLYWCVLALSGLSKRYKADERVRLSDAAKVTLVFAIFGPMLYAIATLWLMLGAELAFLAAQGPLSGDINTAGLMLTTLIVFSAVRKLRLEGSLSWIWLLTVSIAIALCFWIVDSLAVSKADWQKTGMHHLGVYLATAISLTVFGGGLLRMMGVSFRGHRMDTCIRPSPLLASGSLRAFAPFAAIIICIVAPPIWQCGVILWRALLFALPPVTFFTANLSLAYMHAGVIFGLFTLALCLWHRSINFTWMFGAALATSLCSIFLPTSYLGISFGFFYDHIGWSMLLLAPAAMASWYVLSCCKYVRFGSRTK